MAGVLICPPPGSTAAALFITNLTNHPNNTDKSIMVKESGEELDSTCCCLGCCEFDGLTLIMPETVTVSLSGCLAREYILTRSGPTTGPGIWTLVNEEIEGCEYTFTLQCQGAETCNPLPGDPGAVYYSLTVSTGDPETCDTLEIGFVLVSCNPLHLVFAGACISRKPNPPNECAQPCGNDAFPEGCEDAISGEVTE